MNGGRLLACRPARSSDLERLVALARARLLRDGGSPLATDVRWLERRFFGDGVVTVVWESASGEVVAGAGVEVLGDGSAEHSIRVHALLHPEHEDLWASQLAWVDSALAETEAGGRAASSDPTFTVLVASESLSDADVHRWHAAGYELVFEELAMKIGLGPGWEPSPPRWPAGTRLLEWPEASSASFAVYEAAFRERPGWPGWSQAEWTEHMAGDDGFLPSASLCLLVGTRPAAYVVSDVGWISQVGVVPAFRRSGLARAVVTEALLRMREGGTTRAHLHVNTNNPGAVAAWTALGWQACGRRGRFERQPGQQVRAEP